MTTTTQTLFNLTTPPILTQYPRLFPSHLALWEILLNQRHDQKYAQNCINTAPDYETAIRDLLQELVDTNRLFICHPETGEILWAFEN